MKKIFLISLLTILFLIPISSFAGTYYLEDSKKVDFDGLVPCGKPVKVDGSYPEWICTDPDNVLPGYGITGSCTTTWVEAAPDFPCQLCHIFVVFKEIVIFLLLPGEINGGFPIILLIAMLMIIYAGILLMFSGENPENVKKGNGVLKSTGIALLIIYGAWIFIGFFFSAIGIVEPAGFAEGWFQINCPIKYPFKQYQ